MNKSTTTKKSIQQLLQYRHHTKSGSITSQILELLYHNNDKLTIQSISEKFDPTCYPHIKCVLSNMQSTGHITHDNKPYKRGYSLTPFGRWSAISIQLGVPFLSLCLLSDVYHTTTKRTNDKYRIYLLSSFRRLFEKNFDGINSSAIYSKQHIYKMVQTLINRNLVYRTRHDVLQIKIKKLNKLQEYDQDLVLLHDWMSKVSTKCDTVFYENYSPDPKLKHLVPLISPKSYH